MGRHRGRVAGGVSRQPTRRSIPIPGYATRFHARQIMNAMRNRLRLPCVVELDYHASAHYPFLRMRHVKRKR